MAFQPQSYAIAASQMVRGAVVDVGAMVLDVPHRVDLSIARGARTALSSGIVTAATPGRPRTAPLSAAVAEGPSVMVSVD